MAFSAFRNPSMGSPAASPAGGVHNGPDLVDIQTESLGFSAIAGDARLQLLPTPWPADQLPPATASLLSIASHKGLLAAAGPDTVILASTEAVRNAFELPKPADSEFRPFQPQSRLPMPMRISQLAFSADETYLVLSAENGGGLAVYETQALLNGSTQAAFELSTNGQALRALLPNPTPDKAELFAVVTNDGNLMMANLKERNFVAGPNGQVLKSGVSCVSWSTRGKQLVAGLGDGTVHQLTPEGVGKGDIPKPPNVKNGEHVSSIFWLENLLFLTVHTPAAIAGSQTPESIFHIVTRDPTSNTITFQKLIDPAPPFGVDTRSTPHHFLLRLKDFPPNLQDLIAVSSTASTDIGLFTRSKVPLTNDKPADEIAGVFTLTEMSDDSRRAQIPMAPGLRDTSPIGHAFDFSSKEKILRPIPSDSEINESPTPLPLMIVLNNDGVLAAWWVVYNDSIRQGSIYPGLVAAPPSQTVQASPAPAPTQSVFQPSVAPAFGTPSTTGTFGAPSGLGQKSSVWGSASSSTPGQSGASTYGIPAFGSTSAIGSNPTFGSSAMPGNRASPWATAGAGNTPNFGQSSTFGKPSQPLGASTTNSLAAPSSGGGFASFASGGGFAAAGSNSDGGSIFSQKAPPSIFSSPTPATSTNTLSLFGGTGQKPTSGIFVSPATSSSTSTSSPFGVPSKPESKPFGSGGFVLGSTFKADSSAEDDGPVRSNETKSSFLGGGFLNSLGDSAKSPPAEVAVSTETDMDTGDNNSSPEPKQAISTTPTSTPAAPRFGTSNNEKAPSSTGNSFGSSTTSAQDANKPSAGFNLGQATTNTPRLFPFTLKDQSGTPLATASHPLLQSSQTPANAKIKSEPPADQPPISENVPSAPLPPDTTSKDSYAAGDTSNSSIETSDAPLPPDFIPKKPAPIPQSSVPELPPSKLITADMLPPLDVPGGPSSDGGSSAGLTDDEEGSFGEASEDDHSEEASEEGSGEDIANDLSPTSESHQTPAITPQQSFGRQDAPTPDTFFTKLQAPAQTTKLFGEVQKSAPILAPPKNMASPRSPSPVRSALPGRMLRPESSRSVSAPGMASQILSKPTKPTAPPQNGFLTARVDPLVEERRRAEIKAREEAEEAIRLVDDQDDEIQAILTSDLEPTPKLAEFTAHTDYVGDSPAASIPKQVETVYRDINSMIDTLGLNVRALKNFMAYQTEEYKEEGRTREDLEDEEDWCLVEIEDLSSVISNDLTSQLASGRVSDFAKKFQDCKELDKEIHKLRAKREDIRRIFELYVDGSQDEIARSQPLSAEQTASQHDIRRKLMEFQTLLSKAEEGLTTLKASIVTSSAQSGRGKGQSGPTVEAVMRTISKMTSMAEKRSGDIDVLEGQLRNLRFGSTVGPGSREGSPFTTPQKNKASINNFGTSSTSRFYTPDSIKDPRKSLRNSVLSSTGSPYAASPPRKKISGYTADEKAQVRAKIARRKEVTDRLKSTLAKTRTSIWLMNDD